jgi:hypothetical protein
MSFIKTIERSILTCDKKYKRETLNLLLHSVSLFHCATTLFLKNHIIFSDLCFLFFVGVLFCVTPEVQDAAREAVDGLSNNEVANAISDSSQEQNNVISNQADEPRGDSSQPIDAIMNYAQNIVGVRTEPAVQLLVQSNAEADNLARDD